MTAALQGVIILETAARLVVILEESQILLALLQRVKVQAREGELRKLLQKKRNPMLQRRRNPSTVKDQQCHCKNQKGKKEDYEVQDFDDYVEHNDYRAKIPANHFDPAQFQQTIENAAKAAAQVATTDLRRAHEVELKRMQEELRRKKEALNKAKQQPPHHSSNLLNNLF